MLGKAFIIFCHPQVCCSGNTSSATSVKLHRIREIFGSGFFFFFTSEQIQFLKFLGHKGPEELIDNKEMRALLQ